MVCFLLVSLCFAVDTAVNSVFLVGKAEDVFDLLLDRGDTSGVFTFYNISYFFRKFKMFSVINL